MKIPEMTTEHIKNRIKWLEKYITDPQDVVGDYDFNFTISCILEQNERIEKEIFLLQEELTKRV